MYGIVGSNYQEEKKEEILPSYYYQSLFTLQLNGRTCFYAGTVHGHRETSQGGRRGVIPVARIKARGTGTSRRALKMKRGLCDRAGAHCRVPLPRCLIGKIIFPLINNEYDLSNKILCMFRFNSPSFRKGSILPGTSSNLVWLTSAGS